MPYIIDFLYIIILILSAFTFWYVDFYRNRDRRKRIDWLVAVSKLFDYGSSTNTFLSRFAIIFFVSVDMIFAPIGWLPNLYAPIELMGYAVVILIKDVIREIVELREGTPKPTKNSRHEHKRR